MTRSMTAYARSKIEIGGRRFVMELQTVNRKHLEVQIRFHKSLNLNEIEIRKRITGALVRGQVTLRVDPEDSSFRGDNELFTRAHATLTEAARKLGSHYTVTLDNIIAYLPQMGSENAFSEEELSVAVDAGLDEVLTKLMTMKREEGKALAEDIEGRLGKIKEIAREVQILSKDAPLRHQKRVEERLSEIKKELSDEDKERLFRELLLYADKWDITEELTRLSSHIQQMGELLSAPKDSIGKEMEFLLIEMMREASTLTAKSQDASVIRKALEMKSEIEKIREQVQNIE